MKLASTTIPCHNCILLPHCKAMLDDPPTYTDVMMRLYPKCSLLKIHLQPPFESTMEYCPTKVSTVVDFFIYGPENDEPLY